MNDKYLVRVSIGPVQDFIAEARKVRDLCFGSQLLSFITRRALEPFLNGGQADVILPASNVTSKGSTDASIPNQFLAIIPRDDLQRILRDSDTSFRDSWDSLTRQIRMRLEKELSPKASHWQLWDSQLKDLWQYIWVALPVSEEELSSGYDAKIETLQKALESRKVTRTYVQSEGSNVFKCTQCGKRETMGQVGDRDFWKRASRQTEGKIRDGDRLCAVCLVKRFVDHKMLGLSKPVRFDSTADVAAISYQKAVKSLDKTEQELLLGSAQALLRAVRGKEPQSIDDIPGVLFFKDELKPERLVKEFPDCLRGVASGAVQRILTRIEDPAQRLKESLESIKDLGIEPCRYYALLAVDGDKIGKWLSKVNGVEKQREKSRLLGELAQKVQVELEERDWTAVYRGGDDFLAIGPLEEAISVALSIRDVFSKEMGGVTTSAGLVIAHHKNPLRRALRVLRENVEKAKDVYQRDSLVITLWLGSGTIFTGGHRWDIIGKTIPPLISWSGERVSPAFIHDILLEMDAFYDYRGQLEHKVFRDETRRLFTRHLRKGLQLNTEAEELLLSLAMLGNPDNAYFNVGDVKENFENLLRIGSFIARERVHKRLTQEKRKGK